jgi:hypothetical protein
MTVVVPPFFRQLSFETMIYVDKTSLNRHRLKQCRWNQHSFITPTATAELAVSGGVWSGQI